MNHMTDNDIYERLWTSGWSKVSPTAKVSSKVEDWAKVGDYAVIGKNCKLGSWTSIGPLAVVHNNVIFGSWASVGMCSNVEESSELSSHEYVPAGHIRLKSGKTVKKENYSSEDWEIFGIYDSIFFKDGPSVMSNEDARKKDLKQIENQDKFALLYSDFLMRHGNGMTNTFSVSYYKPTMFQRIKEFFSNI